MPPSSKRADIFRYTSYRAYLRAWQAERPGHTFTRLADKAGCALSHISNILNKDPKRRRTLAAHYVLPFADALNLDAQESEYFRLLVQYEDGDTVEDRQRAWQRLSAMKRFHEAQPLAEDAYAYLARWYHVAIREMVGAAGFRADPDWIAEHLSPRISALEARRALDLLLRLGLLRQDADQRLHQATRAVRDQETVSPQIRGQGLTDMTLWALRRLRDSIGRREFGPEERLYLGTTFAVPEQRLQQAMQLTARFREEMAEICEGEGPTEDSSDRDRVYRLQLFFFPLSEWIERGE